MILRYFLGVFIIAALIFVALYPLSQTRPLSLLFGETTVGQVMPYEYDVLPGIQTVDATDSTLRLANLPVSCGWHSALGCGNSGTKRALDIPYPAGSPVYATIRATTTKAGVTARVEAIKNDAYLGLHNPARTGCKAVVIAIDDGNGPTPELITYTHTIANVDRVRLPGLIPTREGVISRELIGTVARSPWRILNASNTADRDIIDKAVSAGIGATASRLIVDMEDGTLRGVRKYSGNYYANTDEFLWNLPPDEVAIALGLHSLPMTDGMTRYIVRDALVYRVLRQGAIHYLQSVRSDTDYADCLTTGAHLHQQASTHSHSASYDTYKNAGLPVGSQGWPYPELCSTTWLFKIQSSNSVPSPTESAACSDLWHVTIASLSTSVEEGGLARFTLTRTTRDLDSPLTVRVSVLDLEGAISGGIPTTARFEGGDSTAPLNIRTAIDATDGPTRAITVTVASGEGYVPGTPGSATVAVEERLACTGTRTLTTSAGSNGSISPSTGPQDCDATVTVTATPDSDDYQVDEWSGTGAGDCTDGATTCDVDMDGSARTISVTFEQVCTLTTSAGSNGSISPASGTQDCDATVTVTATPDSGYVISSWGGDCSETEKTDSTCSVTMDGNQTASVTFESDVSPTFSNDEKRYVTTVGATTSTLLPGATGGNGPLTYSLSGSLPPGHTFTASTRRITGTPLASAAGNTYRSTLTVTDCDGDTDTLSISIRVKDQFTLTVQASNTNGSATGGGTYNDGDDASISATAITDNWVFTGWTGATGIADAAASSTTITMDADKTVTANFDHICNIDSTFPACSRRSDSDAALPGQPGNPYPTVSIETERQTVAGGASIELAATAEVSAGAIEAYAWSGTGTFGDPTAEDTTWTAPAATATERTYTLTLTVTSAGGASASATLDIVVPATEHTESYGDETPMEAVTPPV